MRLGLLHEIRPEAPIAGLPRDIHFEMETMESIQSLALRLEALGHSVRLIDVLNNGWHQLAAVRGELDLVYNYSVGFGSRSREVYAATMCEYFQIPYTGSDPLTLAIASDKHISKLIARAENVRTPAFRLVRDKEAPIQIPADWSHCIAKPMCEGSSIGVTGPLETNDPELEVKIQHIASDYNQPVLVEEFIRGYEVTVPVLGTSNPAALSPLGLRLDGELHLGMRIFDAVHKVDSDCVTWTADLPFPERTVREVQASAARMHTALGCRDLSRSDFRVTPEGQAYYLETNATPQMTPDGGTFCTAAEAEGMSFDDVLQTVLDGASARYAITIPRTTLR